MFCKLERDLHDLGYKYTGQGNLYCLTFIELSRLVDASLITEDLEQGIRQGDLNKLSRFESKLKAKAGKYDIN